MGKGPGYLKHRVPVGRELLPTKSGCPWGNLELNSGHLTTQTTKDNTKKNRHQIDIYGIGFPVHICLLYFSKSRVYNDIQFYKWPVGWRIRLSCQCRHKSRWSSLGYTSPNMRFLHIVLVKKRGQ